ncbi:MAG: restriction endonuclease subunit S [Faecalibacillus sp.]
MNNGNNNPNVPNLRFPYFNNDWLKTTLGDCCNGLDYGLGATAIEYDGKHKYIRITDIDENTKQFININVKSPSFFDEDHKVKNNDILIARTGASVGKTYHYNPKDGELYYAGFLIAAHINQSYDSKFVFYNTQTINYSNWVRIMSARSGQPGINADEYKSYKFYIPGLDEQAKIACFMSKLDQRIQLQNKIINKYESLMNSIKEEILWKSNDLRYVPIKEFLVERNEKSVKQDQYPVLSSTVKGLFLQSDYFQREVASSNNIGYKITKLNDIIISPQNLWMGNITYNDRFENGIVSPSYHIYEIKDGYNKQYISTILKSYKAFYKYKTISEQGASVVRRNLNMDAFLDLMFPIPTKEKQDEVGKIITQLHLKLDIEKKYLNSLQSQKTYLLNNMFI